VEWGNSRRVDHKDWHNESDMVCSGHARRNECDFGDLAANEDTKLEVQAVPGRSNRLRFMSPMKGTSVRAG